jgi:putative heme transporter
MTVILFVAVAGGFFLLRELLPILLVVVVALLLVGTLNPFVEWLERHKVQRTWAVALVVTGCAVLSFLFGLLMVPPLWRQMLEMAQGLPELQARFASELESSRLTAPLGAALRQFKLGDAATSLNVLAAVSVSVSVLERLGYAATALVIAVYFMADRERTRGALYAVIPRRFHVRLARVLLNLETIVGGYMRGQVLTSLAIFLFTFILLISCGVPNALALAAFAGLTDVIPFVGGLLATTPAVIAASGQSRVIAIVVLVALLLYQEFESRFLVPRVYGRALRLPSVVVVLALLVGGKLGGIMGAFLALPIAAALRMLFEELRWELPGSDTHDSGLRERDARAETAYERDSIGASPEEAALVATDIVDQIRKSDAP